MKKLHTVFRTIGPYIGREGDKRDPVRRDAPPSKSAVNVLYEGKIYRLVFEDCKLKVFKKVTSVDGEEEKFLIKDVCHIFREFDSKILTILLEHDEYGLKFVNENEFEETKPVFLEKLVLDAPKVPILIPEKKVVIEAVKKAEEEAEIEPVISVKKRPGPKAKPKGKPKGKK